MHNNKAIVGYLLKIIIEVKFCNISSKSVANCELICFEHPCYLQKINSKGEKRDFQKCYQHFLRRTVRRTVRCTMTSSYIVI